ncbi:MAG: AGE family epimerase/isomerase [Planctomycetes bacterium]|nr:AGE family epimerase/isomerase [Planctomycetota bacterium]
MSKPRTAFEPSATSPMTPVRIRELRDLYRDGLLNDTVPWWQSRLLDHECGGYLTFRDADGTLLSTDKPVWVLGRVIWMWSRLYNEVEQRPEGLEVARHGIDFMLNHAFDSDGRMFFSLTRDGRPLRKRRYLFSETFGTIALAEYARATGSEEMMERARRLYRLLLMYYRTPGLLPPKVLPQTRQLKGHAMPMILLATSQVIRKADPGDATLYDDTITRSMDEVFRDFVKPEKKCLLETVLADGSILDTPEGRTINPGHAIETSWFIMEEGRHRNDRKIVERACQILEWSLDIGWDTQHGGILYFVDCDGKQAEPYEHELKLWWPHNEALYACLLAVHLTGEPRWATWYERLHEWSFAHFPDRKNGEWYGYLRRDGSVSSTVKGNMWKGPFHLPRMQLYGWQVLEQMLQHARA